MMAAVEPSELGRWFDAHAAALVLYARQWVDCSVAQDIVQEVFVRLAAARERPENPRAWLLLCVRNGAIDSLRRRQREGQRAQRLRDRALLRDGHTFNSPLDAQEAEAALQQLPPEEREVITLRIWSGATFEEIALVMGMALSTVHHRYHMGLKSLRLHWELPCPKK